MALVIGVAISALALGIAYYSKENLATLKTLLLPFATALESDLFHILAMGLLVLFLEFFNALQCGFIGIVLGHRMYTAKTGFSVLWGFLIYLGSQTIAVLPIGIVALFCPEFTNLFVTNTAVELPIFKTVIYLATAAYVLLAVLGYFVGHKLFQKGVNVD